jgi:uncharacterized protein YllA (UPF0747 family)
VIFGDITFADEAHGVGAFYPAAYVVCQSSKFVGRRRGPIVVVCWVAEECAVVEEFASVTVHDRQGPMYLCFDMLHAFG